jgi:RNA polymerase sigma-70 factor (ECF subfamily)
MERYVDGDPRAFAELHAQLGPRLRGLAIKLVGREAAVEDLVQLTFLKAHLARDRFEVRGDDADASVQAWYFAIGRNVCMDHLRQRYREDQRTQRTRGGDGDTGRDPIAELADPAVSLEQLGMDTQTHDDVIAAVRAAIAALPATQREVVELHKLQGMTMAEIAERLQVREGAIRVRAHRAYRSLARMLAPRVDRSDRGEP